MTELPELIARAVELLPEPHVRRLAEALEARPGPIDAAARAAMPHTVPSPGFEHDVAPLLAAASASGAGCGELALAMRAALAADRRARGEQRVRLVWTGPSSPHVPLRLTREALIDVIRVARRRLLVLSFAAYRVDEVVSELRAAARRGTDIRLVLESEGVNAAAAFSSLAGVATFWVWPLAKRPALGAGHASLHAKAAVADARVALVTSANLTGHAIAWNMELGLLVEGGPVPGKLDGHVRALMDEGVLERV